MTSGEALDIVERDYPDKTIISYTDYKDWYVFILKPKGEEDEDIFDCAYALNKKTGDFDAFDFYKHEDYFDVAEKKRVVLWEQKSEPTENLVSS